MRSLRKFNFRPINELINCFSVHFAPRYLFFKSNSSLSYATTMESAMMLHWVFENQSKTLAGTLKNLDISLSHQFRILLWGLRENLGSFLQMDQNQKFKSSYDLLVLNWVSTKTFMLCKSGMKWNRKRSCFAKAIQCFILNIE